MNHDIELDGPFQAWCCSVVKWPLGIDPLSQALWFQGLWSHIVTCTVSSTIRPHYAPASSFSLFAQTHLVLLPKRRGSNGGSMVDFVGSCGARIERNAEERAQWNGVGSDECTGV
ncbi:hypothetical protein KCV07_g251, partial [Aureobasidium melanogenum]